MASIRPPRGKRGWEVLYRTSAGRPRSRSFATETAALAYKAEVETDLRRGVLVDVSKAGRERFEANSTEWLASLVARGRKPGTLRTYRQYLRHPVLAYFGASTLASITVADLDDFVGTLRKAGYCHAYIRKALDVVSRSLSFAVSRQKLIANPAAGYSVSNTDPPTEIVPLTIGQVNAVAREIAAPPVSKYGRHLRAHTTYPGYAAMVRLGAFAGLRFEEVSALRPMDIDVARGRVRLSRVLVRLGADERADGYTPLRYQGKTYPSLFISSLKTATATVTIEEVPLPRSILPELVAIMAGKAKDEFLFTSPRGGPVIYSNWYSRYYKPAVERAGLPDDTRFHDLRHTYASLLIAEGITLVGLQKRMRHATLASTQRYSHLYPEVDEAFTLALDASIAAANISGPDDGGALIIPLRVS